MSIVDRIKSHAGLLALVAAAGVGATQWGTIACAFGSTKNAAAQPAERARPAATSVRAEGRLVPYPGAEVTIGTELGGALRRVSVAEKARVKKGDLLAEIAVDEQRAALAEALADEKATGVDVKFLGSELDRTRTLWVKDALPFTALDKADHDRDAARAHRDVAVAAASRLAAVVAKARIVAPIDGVVLSRHAEEGETVAAGAPLFTVCDLSRLRVEAEVDEFDAGRVKLGQEVAVAAEGYDGRSWRGVVEELPDEVVSRRLKPQDPAKPSDTRVLLVKIAVKDASPLRLGQRVEVDIRTPD